MSRDIGDKKDFAKVSLIRLFGYDNASHRELNCLQAKFGSATENWMNFQPTFDAKDTFKTSAASEMLPFEERTEPFKLKTNSLTANEKALEEYSLGKMALV